MLNPEQVQEIKGRLSQLTGESQRTWGKMGVSQMLEHSSRAVQLALNELPARRMFIGYAIGGFIKRVALKDDEPMRENSPTVPGMTVTGEYDFEQERKKLDALIDRFYATAEHLPAHVHPFFGIMDSQEWAILMYKHLDHHLRQFGA